MKTSLKVLVVTLMLGVVSTGASAQDYNTAIGLRGGWQSGLTIKHFLSGDAAVEGLLVAVWKGFEITGLYEIHANAFGVNNLNWYYGAGAHINNFSSGPWYGENENAPSMTIGLDGIIGLEYNIREIPFNISVDWKPEFNLIGHSGLWGGDSAFSVRYTF
jgi:hypothetical protein